MSIWTAGSSCPPRCTTSAGVSLKPFAAMSPVLRTLMPWKLVMRSPGSTPRFSAGLAGRTFSTFSPPDAGASRLTP
jgi:hypothetical protein